ncbi:MAG: ATP-binding protein [Planctomycetes bacterium]|nr:ATP-binding protein [Planctomycetota bacterium]
MSRFFNTEGPVSSKKHYCLPALARVELAEIESLIDREKYFVLHAPRQTGKTTCLLALRDHLNREAKLFCVYANLEVAQGAREDIQMGLSLILREIARRASNEGDPAAERIRRDMESEGAVITSLTDFLAQWCAELKKPLVLLLDEIDSLVGDMLIMVLRHLRAGYDQRPVRFPQSVLLCGVRDVRDYRLRINAGKEVITGGSAFNIKAKSLRLDDFTREDLEVLYGQHTEETAQRFEPEAVQLAWDLTRGQPWLTNALAYEVCFETPEGRDRTRAVTAAMLLAAKEALILRRVTHLHQLADKLREERVRGVIEPMLRGEDLERQVSPDDVEYVMDLGLARRGPAGLEIANPIYREVIPRELTWLQEINLESRIQPAWYVAPDGRLDMEKLLAAFQSFFREHSEHWVERFDYKEAGPQLLLQAYLHRVVNHGGRIEREYGLGRGRTDLLVVWPRKGSDEGREQRAVIELKVLRGDLEKALQLGLEQTLEYQDRTASPEAHLVIFDRRPERSWAEKLYRRVEDRGGRKVVVWGM